MSFKVLCAQLEKKITNSYEEGVTLEVAERLAAEFLVAMIKTSDELKKADLDARMRKSGLKAISAAIYMESATKDPKKPSDVMLQYIVDMSELVIGERNAFDAAEAESDNLNRYYNIFKEAHIYFRGIAKGKFE